MIAWACSSVSSWASSNTTTSKEKPSAALLVRVEKAIMPPFRIRMYSWEVWLWNFATALL